MFQDRLTKKINWPNSFDDKTKSLVNGLLEIDVLYNL